MFAGNNPAPFIQGGTSSYNSRVPGGSYHNGLFYDLW